MIDSTITETMTHAVFVRDLKTGLAQPKVNCDDLAYSVAVRWAKAWNEEEADNARMEQREVQKHFFAMRATTTYEEV